MTKKTRNEIGRFSIVIFAKVSGCTYFTSRPRYTASEFWLPEAYAYSRRNEQEVDVQNKRTMCVC